VCAVIAHNGRVSGPERAVFEAINGLTSAFEQVGNLIQYLGVLAVGPLVIVVALVLRRWRLAGAAALVTVLKLLIERGVWKLVYRERPSITEPNAIVRGSTATTGASFVSDHVILSTGLAWAITPYLHGRWRAAPWIVVGMVAFARIYLGAHNPLDVVGGLALGVVAGGSRTSSSASQCARGRRLSQSLTRLPAGSQDAHEIIVRYLGEWERTTREHEETSGVTSRVGRARRGATGSTSASPRRQDRPRGDRGPRVQRRGGVRPAFLRRPYEATADRPGGAPALRSHRETRSAAGRRRRARPGASGCGHRTIMIEHRFSSMGCEVVVGGASTRECAAIERLFEQRDRTFSRFIAGSELNRVNAAAGRPVMVSSGFADALQVALRVSAETDGSVDPTLGGALVAAGYDRDFAALTPDPRPPAHARAASPVVAVGRVVFVPLGVQLDLNGVVKAMAVDDALAALTGDGFVSAGGDIATRGALTVALPGEGSVSLRRGALATSGSTKRQWLRAGEAQHHLLDRRTGRPAVTPWSLVTACGATCVAADIAAKAGFLAGTVGPAWLDARGIPARFVDLDGAVRTNDFWERSLREAIACT
jgi:thiamine biosynthesis lipoprotein